MLVLKRLIIVAKTKWWKGLHSSCFVFQGGRVGFKSGPGNAALMDFRLGIINVNFKAKGQLLIIYSVCTKYLRKNGTRMKQCISSL
jgi:hypothetical protein